MKCNLWSLSTSCLTIISCLLIISCHQPADPPEEQANELGDISTNYSGIESAQPFFKKGMLLLHSFEYKDAAEQFQKAREIDPDFTMAYWGEIMTHNHPLWSAQYEDEGKAVLKALGETLEIRAAKAKTPIEKDLLTSAEILFGDGDKLERDKAYANYMEKLYKKYVDNHEVASLYALSLLGSASDGRDEEIYSKSASIVQNILKKNPDHPGALHYLIHSYDDPGHAHLALNAANKYAKVAPDAGHALHMPSHIYIALGMWDEVISSNIASWEASTKRKDLKDLDNDALNYHALQWLMYGYLQKGETSLARSLLMDMEKYAQDLPSSKARVYRVLMRAGFLAETGEWNNNGLTNLDFDISDLNLAMQSLGFFIEGMGAYSNEDIPTLKEVILNMAENCNNAEKELYQKGAQMCSGVGWAKQLPSQVDVNHARIMEMELKAMLSNLEMDKDQTELWLNKATELESNTSFMFGPPIVAKPSHELYGEWLLQNNQREEARKQFETALERAPKRRISMEGIKACGTSI